MVKSNERSFFLLSEAPSIYESWSLEYLFEAYKIIAEVFNIYKSFLYVR